MPVSDNDSLYESVSLLLAGLALPGLVLSLLEARLGALLEALLGALLGGLAGVPGLVGPEWGRLPLMEVPDGGRDTALLGRSDLAWKTGFSCMEADTFWYDTGVMFGVNRDGSYHAKGSAGP